MLENKTCDHLERTSPFCEQPVEKKCANSSRPCGQGNAEENTSNYITLNIILPLV